MKLKLDSTLRGFGVIRFDDANGNHCSMQDSSAARFEGLIWLGNDTKGTVNVMRHNGVPGWTKVDLNEVYGKGNVVINDRMHLTQTQVKDMLPFLQHFAEHGYLPSETEL